MKNNKWYELIGRNTPADSWEYIRSFQTKSEAVECARYMATRNGFRQYRVQSYMDFGADAGDDR